MATKESLEIKIEQLRIEEISKRAIFVEALEALSNAAARAAHKIGTRAWEDGLACIGRDIENMNDAQDDLENVIEKIKWAQWCIDNDDDE